MAQLIQMRQRIKAIETIKKVTHAMRLISMSSHTRLQSKRSSLDHYHKEIAKLLERMQQTRPHQEKNNTNAMRQKSKIVIVIGSQKGLCGSFNSSLFSLFDLFVKKNLSHKNFKLIIVGKQAIDSLKTKHKKVIKNTYDQLTSANLSGIAYSITQTIIQSGNFSTQSVWVVSNVLKSFFSQKPKATSVLPFAKLKEDEKKGSDESFIVEQSFDKILNYIKHEYLYSTIYHLLLESLTAEQASRFVSMDNSTRNAKNLLESTRHEYNKARQSKITSELAELTSNI